MVIHKISQLSHYIKNLRRIRLCGATSLFLLSLLLLAIIVPLYNIEGVEDTMAATGTAQDSTLTFTATRTTASVDLNVNDIAGTFATSDNDKAAAFSLSTNNYTGYTLTISSPSNTTSLSGSAGTLNSLPASVATSGISAATFNTATYNNTWGYQPNYKNSTANTNFFPAPTSTATTLDATETANATAKNYTIALGVRANYAQASGTYTNSTLVLSYVANPVTYAISYDKGSATEDPANLPATQSGSVSTTSVTLSSTIPTRTAYNFTGWCLGTISTANNIDSCTGTTFATGASFGIDKSTANVLTLHAMWNIKTFTCYIEAREQTATGTYGSYAAMVNTTVNYGGTCQWSQAASTTFEAVTGYNNTNVTSDISQSYNIDRNTRTISLTKGTGVSIVAVTGTGVKSGANTASATVYYGGAATITATMSSNYDWVNWTGSATYANRSQNLTNITSNLAFTANGKSSAPGSCTSAATCMQTFAFRSCTTSGTTLTDARDGNTYGVKKIGNLCWMTSNLKIMGTVTAALSNFSGSDFNIAGGGSLTSGNTYTAARATLSTNSTYPGAYYNYCAASAGTICTSSNSTEASSDICPKGWRLPTNSEFGTIGTSSGSTTNVSAFGALYSGGYLNGTLYGTGADGLWWSSTADNTTDRYRLNYYSGKLYTGSYNVSRQNGYSIRCVKSS